MSNIFKIYNSAKLELPVGQSIDLLTYIKVWLWIKYFLIYIYVLYAGLYVLLLKFYLFTFGILPVCIQHSYWIYSIILKCYIVKVNEIYMYVTMYVHNLLLYLKNIKLALDIETEYWKQDFVSLVRVREINFMDKWMSFKKYWIFYENLT